jgi:hypothetical protein
LCSQVFLLLGLGLENATYAFPGSRGLVSKSYAESNLIIYFGISMGFYLAIYLSQVLFMQLVYCKYVR